MTTGIILAGGQSRRMGTNKALLRLHPTGPCLLDMVIAALRPVVTDILLSTNQPEIYSGFGLSMVADNFKDCGPLAGLEAGLTRSKSEINLLVACDMPFMVSDVLRFLLQFATDYAAVIPRSSTGRFEPLCAVYNQSCLPSVRVALRAKSYKMTDWLSGQNVRYVETAELVKYDWGLSSFRNLNYPDELSIYKNMETEMEIKEGTIENKDSVVLLTHLQELAKEVATEINEILDADANEYPAQGETSVKELVCHLRDAEQIFTGRVHRILDENEPFLRAYNTDELAQQRDYKNEVWDQVRTAYTAVRTANLDLLATLKPDAWHKVGQHEAAGEVTIYSLTQALAEYNAARLERIRHLIWLAK